MEYVPPPLPAQFPLTSTSISGDPRVGTPPSVLDNASVLTLVSLYYLTDSFISSEYIYAQNPGGFLTTYKKARTNAPLLFTNFEYNLMYWPREYVERVGNMVYFQGRQLLFFANWNPY
jgi:hypothetical protein